MSETPDLYGEFVRSLEARDDALPGAAVVTLFPGGTPAQKQSRHENGFLAARESWLDAFAPLVGCVIGRERADALAFIAAERQSAPSEDDLTQVEEDLLDHGLRRVCVLDKGTKAIWLPVRDSPLLRRVAQDENTQMDLINFARDYSLIGSLQVMCKPIGEQLYLENHYAPGLDSVFDTLSALMREAEDVISNRNEETDEYIVDACWWRTMLESRKDFIEGLREDLRPSARPLASVTAIKKTI